MARWQLATGRTVVEGWTERFGRAFQIWFLVYLLLWTLIVSAALMSACGLAIHALIPAIPVPLGGRCGAPDPGDLTVARPAACCPARFKRRLTLYWTFDNLRARATDQ